MDDRKPSVKTAPSLSVPEFFLGLVDERRDGLIITSCSSRKNSILWGACKGLLLALLKPGEALEFSVFLVEFHIVQQFFLRQPFPVVGLRSRSLLWKCSNLSTSSKNLLILRVFWAIFSTRLSGLGSGERKSRGLGVHRLLYGSTPHPGQAKCCPPHGRDITERLFFLSMILKHPKIHRATQLCCEVECMAYFEEIKTLSSHRVRRKRYRNLSEKVTERTLTAPHLGCHYFCSNRLLFYIRQAERSDIVRRKWLAEHCGTSGDFIFKANNGGRSNCHETLG